MCAHLLRRNEAAKGPSRAHPSPHLCLSSHRIPSIRGPILALSVPTDPTSPPPPRSCARSPRSPPEVPFSLTAAAVNGDRRLASPPGSPLGGCGDVRVHPGGSPLQEPLWGCHWRGAEGCALYPSMAVRSPPPEVFRCFLRHAEFSSLQCFVCGEDGGGDREGVS